MLKKFFFVAIIYSLFGGCSNKLNLLAPYKESVSVYGLLNQNDTTSYIRIERVFLGAGNAYTMAQNRDSIYFAAGELRVSLQRWKNGTQISVDSGTSATAMEIVLTDTLMTASSGTFNTNERVYKTKHRLYASDTGCVYKLIIHNNKTGKEYTTQTPMVAGFQLIQATNGTVNALAPSFFVNPNLPINIVPGNQGIVTCQYNSPVNAGVCSLTMRLHYTEYNGGGTAKYVDLGLGTNYPGTIFGGENQKFDYLGASLLSYIASAIPVPTNPTITRSADYIEFLLTAGGPDLALYNQVNASTSLSQNVPNYSNISGGVGVFSSRYQLSLKRLLTTQCLDTLAGSSVTCALKFLNSTNSLSPCH